MTDADRPVLEQVNLVVRDMEAAVAFYRRLGVDLPDDEPDWDPHHRSATMPGGLDFDLDSETFAKVWNEGLRTSGPAITFRFPSREAVDATYADLVEAGARGQQPPYDAFWGARFALVEDPDGNVVGLMSPSDPAHRRPPPAPSEWS